MKNIVMTSQKFHILLTVLVMTLIFIQSALPGDLSADFSNSSVQPIVQLMDGDLFTIDRVVRKLAHVTEYLVLGLCLMVNVLDLRKSREGQRPQGGRRSVIADCGIAWAVGTIYAVTDEFHQTLVPGRSGEVLDVCIDAAGVLCGVVVMSVIAERRRDKKGDD